MEDDRKVFLQLKTEKKSMENRIPFTVYKNEFVSVIGSQYEALPETDGVVVYNTHDLYGRETVEKNVSRGESGAFRSKDSKILHRRHVAGIMKKMKLEGIRVKHVNELSALQVFQVEMAYLLMSSPDVILFNNSFQKTDSDARTEIMYAMADLQRELGVAFLYITNDDWEAMRVSTRVAVMNGSKIEQIGSPEEIYYAPVSREVAAVFECHNIFEGYIQEKNGSVARIVTEFGTFDMQADEFEEDEILYISVRPEMIRILENTKERGKGIGVITAYHFMGNGYEVTVKLVNGQRVIVYLPARLYEPGSIIALDWDTEDAALMHTKGDSIYSIIEGLSKKVGNSLRISM